MSIDLFREIVRKTRIFENIYDYVKRIINYIRFEGFDLNELNYNKIETKKDIINCIKLFIF